MPSRRAIRGVLGNFLGTYLSRYSDYDGYWLFGVLVDEIDELQVDLLGLTNNEPTSRVGWAASLATTRFKEQLLKSGFERWQVRSAFLTIRRPSHAAQGFVNGTLCDGFNIEFLASAVMDNDKCFQQKRVVFVASHNPCIERRSIRRL